MNIALKYRPIRFKDLVGQDILVRILKNAFTLNKIPQSILLSGSSGIGKTTTARIIALYLNCSSQESIQEPCGICENCIAIKLSNHPDVIEIDAASNTSIEDVKVILGNICYAPMRSKYKIYIIDEVHMLSNSAFNALLTTLESPPSNVKFILATTEIKKIPMTIISRCYRFDLHKITIINIIERLYEIAQQETFSIERGSLELIAKHSSNSMRNALFLMNQAVLYSGDNTTISIIHIREILGLVDSSITFKLLDAILMGDIKQAILIFDTRLHLVNPIKLFEDILHTIQLICRFLIIKDIDVVIPEYEQNEIKALSIKKNLIFFARLWKVLLKGLQDIQASTCSDVAIEMILISLCYLTDLPSPEQLMKNNILTYHDQAQNINNVEKIKQQNYDFEKILQLLQENDQLYLYKELSTNLELVECNPGYLKLKAKSKIDGNFYTHLKNYLEKMFQKKWIIESEQDHLEHQISNVSDIPEIKDVLDAFQGAQVIKIQE
ncbi:DNA polymerase III subunit gamma/tau [Wolbachia endosymbiont of Howardula sp.]|uniref:DNA polymerase III subunit gamma/tau n=1 Tax=Wolbachia endosymbiont of Howardula sp. TaxID=2916816 RepID=UPI00217DB630|nr:DNA polymerase III subunit gamma/tau [Wolbachia endosymbiont of Howardula sp.]UWI83332.1 DNA polymerase III subunit gamma/tau [Wolbachia endosymbiont of Howardula sp.]